MWVSWKLLFSLLFMNCGTSAAPLVEIFAYNGRDAKVSCSYPPGYESYEKYLCTENCGSGDVLVTTTEGRKNRYFISDDLQRQIFTVTISNVSWPDAGKYWCGVSKNLGDLYTEVKVHVNADKCCESVRTIQGYEDNSVSIGCPYQSEFVSSLKYLCKTSQPSTCLQQALVTTNTKQNRRFTLNVNHTQKFTVDITGVTKQDAGSYLCGIERKNNFDVFSRVDLTVREWCCVTSQEVKGVVGQSVTLQCPYPSQHVSNKKFLCKGDQRNTCQTVVTSAGPKDKLKLQEDRSSSSFSVTITGLAAADAGTYWCGSDAQWTPNTYNKIQLSIEWCCVTSQEVKGVVGQSVTLQCPYPSQHVSNRKFLCKGDQRNTCQTVVTSASPKDRLKLQEDRSSSSFSVTITGLVAADAGTYWCGSDAQWTPNTYNKIQLSIEYLTVTVSPTKITINGSQSTYNKDAGVSHIVLYVVPAILLMLIVVTSVIIYKYCCLRVQGARGNNSINSAKEDIEVTEVYNNQEVVNSSKINAYRRGDDLCEHQEDTLYENFSNEHIYSNY